MPVSDRNFHEAREFQAVFGAPDRLFRDALTVLIALYPVVVRFSFAIGETSTAINCMQTYICKLTPIHVKYRALASFPANILRFLLTFDDPKRYLQTN